MEISLVKKEYKIARSKVLHTKLYVIVKCYILKDIRLLSVHLSKFQISIFIYRALYVIHLLYV